MEDDPDKLKGPGGLTLRQVHEQVQKSVERDRQAQLAQQPAQARGLWRRFVNYFQGRK